ncbi:hypothetical protein HFP15_33495 [Amycolatopsis sp. K13G38]|uniref:DUF6292 domain-containing protein n=1 Tax=Amycolatopsis acididurans TaxID=2724524 RepID=A0ABX1JHS2_9PSEU|nr:DUF6292 family protein [Amycolatopsis acididurans]NKQ57787.1 hypothetical protein [Amycolatopsis acididurans]
MMLTKPEERSRVERGLECYVRAVSAQLGLPPTAAVTEVADTAGAYIPLARRSARFPDEDLMLAWNDREGWFVGLDADPGHTPRVIGYLGGPDPLPKPSVVRAFVDDLVAGHWSGPVSPPPHEMTEDVLAARLGSYLG